MWKACFCSNEHISYFPLRMCLSWIKSCLFIFPFSSFTILICWHCLVERQWSKSSPQLPGTISSQQCAVSPVWLTGKHKLYVHYNLTWKWVRAAKWWRMCHLGICRNDCNLKLWYTSKSLWLSMPPRGSWTLAADHVSQDKVMWHSLDHRERVYRK